MAGNGLLAQWYAHGVEGLVESGRGMLVGVVVLFGLFAIRVLGAGDVKLVGAVGTFVGNRIWEVLLCICFMTGVIAVCRMIYITWLCRDKSFTEIEKIRVWGRQLHMSVPVFLGVMLSVMGGVRIGI